MPCPILVVDDDAAICMLVAELIRDDGHVAVTAEHGADALSQLDAGLVPELIILDMRMPVMDGWKFARALGERGLQIPVLVMTAAQSARRWAEEIRAAGYLAKPFDIDEFSSALHQFCN